MLRALRVEQEEKIRLRSRGRMLHLKKMQAARREAPWPGGERQRKSKPEAPEKPEAREEALRRKKDD
jgi:hypothetical protein